MTPSWALVAASVAIVAASPYVGVATEAVAEEVESELEWLDGAALGLQRGFVINKAIDQDGARAEDPWQKQSAAVAGSSVDDEGDELDWLATTALGLQRGFVIKKKYTNAGAKDVSQTPAAARKDSSAAMPRSGISALGLQRGFHVKTIKAIQL